jgi:hypothetical protein
MRSAQLWLPQSGTECPGATVALAPVVESALFYSPIAQW